MKMTRLIPILPVRSMPGTVDFYCRMLGFAVEKRNDDWGCAMLRFDGCRLMVGQSINAHPAAHRDPILYLYPDDTVAYRSRGRQWGQGGNRVRSVKVVLLQNPQFLKSHLLGTWDGKTSTLQDWI